MRMSQYFLGTFKRMSNYTDSVSHQLMLSAGLIRKVSSGLYVWLPSGLRILRKLEKIIREEMNKIGGIEVVLPIVQPAKLWKISDRWIQYGPELLRFKNRNNQEFVLSPTHEELIAEIISNEIVSYKQLPLILYQIQNKFRDEIRPRYGMLRSREFLMKDGYSFHVNDESLQNTYDIMYCTYNIIFKRFGLNFRVIQADSGNIGGNISHEFHALVNHGEDIVVYSTTSDYTANMNSATCLSFSYFHESVNVREDMRLVKICDIETITEIVNRYNISPKKIVKTFLVRAKKKIGSDFVVLLIRSDHEFNYEKIEKLSQVDLPLSFANEDEIDAIVGVNSSVLGPINLPFPIIADRDVAYLNNFIAGANVDHGYFFGINWGRDLFFPIIADLRKVVSGDYSPDGKGILKVTNSIEIGHIFQLGNKYVNLFTSRVQGKDRKILNIAMGCYGIGVSRIVPAIIEQNNDELGIVWPVDMLAPFFLVIIPINMYRSCNVAKVVEDLYIKFSVLNIDVLLDDRDEFSGVMFADSDLIGIPHSIIVSDTTLHSGEIEYKYRKDRIKKRINLNDIDNFITSLVTQT